MNLFPHIERVMVIDCSRCANQDISYDDDSFTAAEAQFLGLGWTVEGPRVFCPQCNGERKK